MLIELTILGFLSLYIYVVHRIVSQIELIVFILVRRYYKVQLDRL